MSARDAHGLSEGPADLATRVDGADWGAASALLDAQGSAVLERLVTRDECEALAALYDCDDNFRSRVVMQRHGFGRGEYKYLAYPLPAPIARLRAALYAKLAPLANAWNERMGVDALFPPEHASYLERCHDAGQAQPTPLLLRYMAGDYNCLHQDIYGDLVFPLQVIVLLSEPGRDFNGGELVMTEQRPRMQSRVHVVPLRQGDAAVIAVRQRPVRGARGTYRVSLRHGVSPVRRGTRHTAGIIFHDAQ